jgi:nicotinate-nucleotide pyrophosphorylase
MKLPIQWSCVSRMRRKAHVRFLGGREAERLLAGTRAHIVDTRKTIPGLRLAQKYAVRVGGGTNHRIGLHDAVLIKENHIAAAGGVTAVLKAAQAVAAQASFIEIEVETLEQLTEALDAGAKMVLLDNMPCPCCARQCASTRAARFWKSLAA